MLKFKQRMISGLLVLVPLGITLFVLSLLFRATAGLGAKVLGLVLNDVPVPALYLLGIVATMLILYTVGLLASNVVGKRLIALAERIVEYVPIVTTVYGATKQVIEMFMNRPESERQQAALVDFPSEGLKAVGFVTGRVTTPDGTDCYTIFVPTTPNPTTGFLQFIAVDGVEILDMDTEEAFKVIMSAGMLAPRKLAAKARLAP